MAGKREKTASSATLAERFFKLFPSNLRSSGRYDPARDRPFTEYEPLTAVDFQRHLDGKMGCGGVPIHDDNSCMWGAIDFDNHDSDEDLPIVKMEEIARANALPLLLCRSKSGGVHAYLFMEKPIAASRVKMMLTKWAATLGYPGSEIFPKQSTLGTTKEGKLQLGNWLNLPYMNAAKTLRYCIFDGKKLSADEFVLMAEKLRVNEAQLRGYMITDHPDAPPCIQRLLSHGVAQGHRNEGLYNIVVYLKKSAPKEFEAKAAEINSTVFAKPLPRSEMGRTIASAARPDYGYRCNEEPIRSLCDRETCLKRKFGITPEDAQKLATTEALPSFTELVKYLSEPVRWELKIDGVKVTNISTPQLLEWRAMREVLADRLTKVVPLIHANEWARVLADLMKEARIVDAPDDASVAGAVRDRLREFASKTDLLNRGEDVNDRKALLRGNPVVQKYEGTRMIMFRGQDFVNYLKRTKSEELKGINLWFAVKELGVQHTKLRCGDSNINIWYLPLKEVTGGVPEAPNFKSEL